MRSALRYVPWELVLPVVVVLLWAWTWPLWWNECSHQIDLTPRGTCSIVVQTP